jgi:nucleotide-binding universal stress UspA family protein
MSSIVVPVNFAANAANAARYAVDLASSLGMDIHLVNVLELPKDSPKKFSADVHEELLNSCLELLQQLAAELSCRCGGTVRIATDLETGNLHDSLAKFCKAIRPFAIVCGSPESPPENILDCSSTINSIRQLPYPLLIVPENASFHTIRNVLIACDHEDIHTGIVNARPMLEALNHAFSPAISIIRQPDVAKGIAGYLQSHTTDLLVVLPKKHGWLDSYKSRSRQLLSVVVPILSGKRKK